MQSKTEKPYVIYLAEVIYKNIVDIKKNNSDISNVEAPCANNCSKSQYYSNTSWDFISPSF